MEILCLDVNIVDNLFEGLLNSIYIVNVFIDRRKENVYCDFYKRLWEECIELFYFICMEIMDIKEDFIKYFFFFKYFCVFVSCENK